MRPTILEYSSDQPAASFAERIRDGLLRGRVVITRGVDPKIDQKPFWDEVSESVGTGCYEFCEDYRTGLRTGEKWQEIRFDPAIQNAYRYSKNAQPLHTDGSYNADGPEIVFFYCIKAARSGGATTFIDGPDLVELLRREERALYEDLVKTPVLFSKANDNKRRPIVSEDARGPLFTWNYYCVDPSEPPEIKELAERFHGYLQRRVVGDKLTLPICLSPGEAVFFHDERLLHGRDAFEAEAPGDRFLLKSAFNLEREPRARSTQ
jgi:alpha-ketoglutarate-dependent taurine dioxygenase